MIKTKIFYDGGRYYFNIFIIFTLNIKDIDNKISE